MTKQYKVLVREHGRMKIHEICNSLEEARDVMSKLNQRLLSKAYKRAYKRGRSGIGHQQYQEALSQTAISY